MIRSATIFAQTDKNFVAPLSMELAKVECTWTEFVCYVFVLLTSSIRRLTPHVLMYGNDMRKRKNGGEAHVSCSQQEAKILKLRCPRPSLGLLIRQDLFSLKTELKHHMNK